MSVRGTVAGGGPAGPGGAIVWLKRLDGPTPPVNPGKRRLQLQRGKQFVPRVLPVPLGTQVDFRNEDGVFHRLFLH